MKVSRLPVQVRVGAGSRTWAHRIRDSVPREMAEAAWEGYDADGHGRQSCERLHQRGGFSLAELAYYLARAVDEGRAEVRVVPPSPKGAE